MLLVQKKLPPGWIDLSVGEPHLIRKRFLEVFPAPKLEITEQLLEYPFPQGYPPLVKLLEDKFQAPVIITNGAKQGLFVSLNCLKWKKIAKLREPYWALLPELLQAAGIEQIDDDLGMTKLVVAPNNPDGWYPSEQDFTNRKYDFIIHDAAYFTKSYLPLDFNLKSFGDIEIYSFSKMLGIPGLRLGCVVVKNNSTQILERLLHQMELVTVGVSKLSQLYLIEILQHASPSDWETFYQTSNQDLVQSKKIIESCSSIDFPKHDQYHGMFGWGKVKNGLDFSEAKIRLLPGETCGCSGMVRVNLALDHDKLEDFISRVNKESKQ